MPKVMAVNWNGGMAPDASVKSASSAHMATAEKPISVALPTKPSAVRMLSGRTDGINRQELQTCQAISPSVCGSPGGFGYFSSSKRAAAMVMVPISVVAVILIGA